MLYAQIGDGGSDFGVAAALSLLLMALCVAVMGVGDACPAAPLKRLCNHGIPYPAGFEDMEKNRADTLLRIAPRLPRWRSWPNVNEARGAICVPWASSGPAMAIPRVCEAAYRVAGALAQAGMSIVNGGRGGVMAAASRGARDGGGIAIGLLPEDDDRNANEWLSVAVATGMGEMRNALVARSAVPTPSAAIWALCRKWRWA